MSAKKLVTIKIVFEFLYCLRQVAPDCSTSLYLPDTLMSMSQQCIKESH